MDDSDKLFTVDFDRPVFTVADTAELMETDRENLVTIIRRGHLQLGETDIDAPRGGTRYLSLRRVVQFAIAKTLTSLGLGWSDAFAAAREFTDRPSEYNCWDHLRRENFREVRQPCRVFSVGETVLLVGLTAPNGERFVAVENSLTLERIDNLLEALPAHAGCIIHVNPILDNALARVVKMGRWSDLIVRPEATQ